MTKSEIIKMLTGNDRRTIAHANLLVSKLTHDRTGLKNLYHLLSHEDADICFRASDTLEKILRNETAAIRTLSPYLNKDWPKLIGNEALQMHLPLILGYVAWKKNDATRIGTRLLELAHTTKNKFVTVNTMTGLADIALRHTWLVPTVWGLLDEMEMKGSAALRARARILKKKINLATKL
ncbi:MAG TPA: hypothetical protein PLH27_16465 [bacterium]|nr:hypothetical protein [bacterium]HMW37112.1 hypothetical protein [bacterium]HMY35028.1 hypothetical protein [bacterium]HMZ03940.1 hypothetical protein [bacterium]HNC50585.1 hypothetical protein [bacterium]